MALAGGRGTDAPSRCTAGAERVGSKATVSRGDSPEPVTAGSPPDAGAPSAAGDKAWSAVASCAVTIADDADASGSSGLASIAGVPRPSPNRTAKTASNHDITRWGMRRILAIRVGPPKWTGPLPEIRWVPASSTRRPARSGCDVLTPPSVRLSAAHAWFVGPRAARRAAGLVHASRAQRRWPTAMPATIIANATPWNHCGASPSTAADSTAANTGVRLLKNAATAGPASATPAPQVR